MKLPIRYVHLSYEGDDFYDAAGNEITAEQIVEYINAPMRELREARKLLQRAADRMDMYDPHTMVLEDIGVFFKNYDGPDAASSRAPQGEHT